MSTASVRGWPDFGALTGLGHKDFALLHRPQAHPSPQVELLAGDSFPVASFSALTKLVQESSQSVLAVLPYNVIGEFGHPCHRDDAALLALRVAYRESLPLDIAVERLPMTSGELTDVRFSQDDDEYAKRSQR
ncbi:hypothetical protein DMP23_20005 [Amycolatopsis sp. A1MSW2902]|uniref:hypothetical protein n=1 Tax=Amycolatopsis sp. A1MSW2902 TaxID=687413 RepID=UPI00307EB0D7